MITSNAASFPDGYAGKLLRVDLTSGRMTEEALDGGILRKYLGGTGLGIKLLYDEVPPNVQWSDPENRVIIATGPLTGTSVGGTGGFSLVTKGCLTNGATSVQANGFMGAYLKFCGFDGIILYGAATGLTYLFIGEGGIELKDAAHLAGKDTWETERIIKEELGRSERDVSVFSIGPAGENLVKFAALVGDKGHVASHNGVGAVMGSKKLKAIAVARGKSRTRVNDRVRLSTLAKAMFQEVTATGFGYNVSKWGTLGSREMAEAGARIGLTPVKNYTTSLFSEWDKFNGENVRSEPQFELHWHPCWACRFHHCNLIKIVRGPFAGFAGEEPEYELWAGFGPLIGQGNLDGAVVLANEVDLLGMDGNESAWLIAWLMECYQKGIITREDMDGLEMRWGDVGAVRAMLGKIAQRDGFGDILAEGVMRAAHHFGGEAQKLAVYTEKGNTPRMHDHRSAWHMLLDTVVSDTGSDEDGTLFINPVILGLSADIDRFSADGAATLLAELRGSNLFDDCLVICRFNKSGIVGDRGRSMLAELVSAATGWDFDGDEVKQVGLRVANLLRAFNIRHGHKREVNVPSLRYGSTPVDGPYKDRGIVLAWNDMLNRYHELMGWDKDTGKPLPETLKKYGMEHIIKDIW